MLQAIGAERAILSIILKQPDSLLLIDDVLDVKDFTNIGNQMIYGVMKEVISSNPSSELDSYVLISKAEELGLKDFFDSTQNGKLIDALGCTKDSVNVNSLMSHVAAVKTASIKRNLIGIFDYLKDDIESFSGSPMELRNFVESQVFGAVKNIDSGGDDIENLSESFEENINSFADGEAVHALDIGFSRWQRDCGGIKNGTVHGIFARAKTGKSQLAAHAGCITSIIGSEDYGKLPVLYLDSELLLRDQQMRICSMLTGIPFDTIESGSWKSNKEQIEKISNAFKKVKNAPFYYKNIAGRSINHVIPLIRKFVRKYVGHSNDAIPKCLVIYDYIKLSNPKDIKDATEWQMLGFLISALHDLAVQDNIPILVFGQLNREGLRVDSVSTIAGSDRISHNLDSLTLFRKKRPEEIELDGTQRGDHLAKVVIARHGPGHDYDDWVNFHFDKSCCKLVEDKRNSEITESIQNLRQIRDRLNDDDDAPGLLGVLRED